jgi:hypothetical protein
MAHSAFQRHPTNHFGVLRTDNFSPLTLQGVFVDVEIRDACARVQLTYDYKNTSSSVVSVFAAFPMIPRWTLSSMKCESTGGSGEYVKSVVGVADGVCPAPVPESEAFVPSVATQAVPWELRIHEHLVSTAVYYGPADLSAGVTPTLRFVVPKELFPRRVDIEEPAQFYNSQFDIKGIGATSGKLARTIYMHVHGVLLDSLSKPPTILAGENAVGTSTKNTFSAKWETHAKDLFVAYDLVFEAELTVANDQPLTLSLCQDISAKPQQQQQQQADNGGSSNPAGESTLVPVECGIAGTLAISPVLTPEQLSVANDEIIFLIDASASMLPVWSEVLRAVKLAVASLPSTTYVNVVWFSNETEFLFPNGSELITQKVKDTIVEDLLGYSLRTPTVGGTKLYQAVQAIYKQPYITGFARHVVLITDSGAEEALALRTIDIVRSNTHSTCFSAVGVGSSHLLHQKYLESLTREGRGVFDIATTPTTIANSVARIIRAVHVPTLVNVVIRAEYDGDDDQVPPVTICTVSEHMSLIAVGQRVLVPFFANSVTAQPFTFVVSGLVGLHHIDYKMKSGDLRALAQQSMTEAGRPETSSVAHVNAALHRLERLTSGADRSAMSPQERAAAVALSRAFFIPSPTVGYVSTSHLTAASAASGSQQDDTHRICTARYYSSRAQRRVALEAAGARPTLRDATGVVAVDADVHFRPFVENVQRASAEVSTKEFVQRRVVEEILRLAIAGGSIDDVLLSQRADGSFDPSARLLAGLGVTDAQFTSTKPADADDATWATSLACAYLDENSDANVVQLGAIALVKGRRLLKSSEQDAFITTAKRVLSTVH